MTFKPQHFLNVIAGEARGAGSGEVLESYDPFTGEVWATVPRCGTKDVDEAVAAAHNGFRDPVWRDMTATARGKLLVRLADLIEAEADRLARIESRDNGKLLAEMGAQLRYIPEWYRYFGGLADKIEGAVLPIDKPGAHVFTRREPLGVIACIVPWNSPLLLLSWKLAAALAAGNTAVIKPSEHASCSTLAFVELFARAGFPPGVVNCVTGLPNEVGEPLARHPLIAKIAFTGGEAGGMAVHRAAAEGMKGVTLELGGKSANIVFADADVDRAVAGAVSGIFAASGQTCIAGSRLLVQRDVYDLVVAKLIEMAGGARLGDPADASTQIGPITTLLQHGRVLDHIARAKAAGARCVLGGGRPADPDLGQGWFVEPTIFTDVDNSMAIAREEIFGPVLAVIPFDQEADAVRIANDSPYGLAAGIWTADFGRAIRVAERLEAGTVWVNTYRAVSFMAPFGGVKRSGLGRENGQHAIDEFLTTKTVWMDLGQPVSNPFVIR